MNTQPPARRILIVSYWFPPFSAVAAVRMGKLAKYLFERGWDVRVLAADDTNPRELKVEIPADRVLYTPSTDVDRYIEATLDRARSLVRKPKAESNETPFMKTVKPLSAAGPKQSSLVRTALRRAYQEIVRLPDNRAGWLSYANKAGDRLIASWRPDVIFATSPPVTSLIAADRLSRRHHIPWIAEFRDLWCDNPYYEYSPLRRSFERMWEARVLARAAAIVSVSPVWQQAALQRFGRPVITAMNGFVPEDYPERPPVAPEASGPLRIVYTGHIYAGHRDPGPLFAALRDLGSRAADVVVEFIGTAIEAATSVADQYGVAHLVKAFPPVPYRRSLEIQLHADVLLHLQWCDPKEVGTVAGKIFDYFGARRPILGIALEDSIVAKMINERAAGLATNDTAKIAKQVAAWIAEKKAGGVAPLPPAASAGLERDVQFEKIEHLFDGIVAGAPNPTRKAG